MVKISDLIPGPHDALSELVVENLNVELNVFSTWWLMGQKCSAQVPFFGPTNYYHMQLKGQVYLSFGKMSQEPLRELLNTHVECISTTEKRVEETRFCMFTTDNYYYRRQ